MSKAKIPKVKQAMMFVAEEWLACLLGLPDGVRVARVGMLPDCRGVAVVVEGDSLPVSERVHPGDRLPVVCPQYEYADGPTARFVAWGVCGDHEGV